MNNESSQEELTREQLYELLQPAIDEANRGEAKPSDPERIKRLGRELLADRNKSQQSDLP